MATSTITSRGQTTILRDAEDVAGMFSDWVKQPVSIDDMNERARQLAAAKFLQGLE